jgi:diguanylate cyclase (GGDEF)-like protein
VRCYHPKVGWSETLSLRYQQTFSILLIDIDHFKSINDQNGHLIGDQVLITIADVLKNAIRATDILGRWGGEEFLVTCPQTKTNEAHQLAEHLRTTIESTRFGIDQPVTISIGVTEATNNDNEETMIGRADKGLYQAKTMGRNQIVNVDATL